MRKYISYSFIILSLSVIIFSCRKDEDEDEDTQQNIIGVWNVKEDHADFGIQYYQVEIMKDGDSSRVKIYNFLDLNASSTDDFFAYARINGFALEISQQMVEKHSILGQGVISSNYNTINLQYSDDDGSGPVNVTAIYTRN